MGAFAGATILTRLINTIVYCVLALLPGEAWLTDTGKAVHLVNAGPTVLAGIDATVVNIDITVGASPAGLARALIPEQPIDADTPDTGFAGTKVHLLLATFSGKAIRTVASKVMDQVSAVASKQAGLFSAVINVDLAERALPAIGALASETTLGQSFAARPIGAGVALF